jgi:hypothetical protein
LLNLEKKNNPSPPLKLLHSLTKHRIWTNHSSCAPRSASYSDTQIRKRRRWSSDTRIMNFLVLPHPKKMAKPKSKEFNWILLSSSTVQLVLISIYCWTLALRNLLRNFEGTVWSHTTIANGQSINNGEFCFYLQAASNTERISHPSTCYASISWLIIYHGTPTK